MTESHECVFVEEQEPEGRLILGPCLTCGLSALDALEQLRASTDTAEAAIRADERAKFRRHALLTDENLRNLHENAKAYNLANRARDVAARLRANTTGYHVGSSSEDEP